MGNVPLTAQCPSGRGRAASSTGPVVPLDWWAGPVLPALGAGERARGQVAQLVEQRTENPRVGGSSPSLATVKHSVTTLTRAWTSWADPRGPARVDNRPRAVRVTIRVTIGATPWGEHGVQVITAVCEHAAKLGDQMTGLSRLRLRDSAGWRRRDATPITRIQSACRVIPSSTWPPWRSS